MTTTNREPRCGLHALCGNPAHGHPLIAEVTLPDGEQTAAELLLCLPHAALLDLNAAPLGGAR